LSTTAFSSSAVFEQARCSTRDTARHVTTRTACCACCVVTWRDKWHFVYCCYASWVPTPALDSQLALKRPWILKHSRFANCFWKWSH